MLSSYLRPKRLLLTGGRGRLAPLIADHFRTPHYATTLYSRNQGAGLYALEDLLNASNLSADDTILHLAWSTLPATSEQTPGIEQQHDLPLLDRLLAAIVRQPVAARPLVIFFSSGGTVYGPALGRSNRETDQCHPIGNYGRAKLAAETRIIAAMTQHDLRATILRISNPYGYPVPHGRPQGIVPHAIRAAVDQQPLALWGTGEARKDFLYYTDFLSALNEIIHQRLTGIFNIASGESRRVRDVITLVEQHTRRTILTTSSPAPPWDVQDSRLDPAKLCLATGWQPQVNLDEGIRRSLAGFLNS